MKITEADEKLMNGAKYFGDSWGIVNKKTGAHEL